MVLILYNHVHPLWQCDVSPCSSLEAAIPDGYDQNALEKELYMTWDEALRKSTQEFQHRSYDLFTCNCHSFVANNLNRMRYSGHGNWNVVTLAAYLFLKATWVGKGAIVRSFLPFFVVLCLGLTFGDATFLMALAALSVALVGWFVIGTYCFKDLIRL